MPACLFAVVLKSHGGYTAHDLGLAELRTRVAARISATLADKVQPNGAKGRSGIPPCSQRRHRAPHRLHRWPLRRRKNDGHAKWHGIALGPGANLLKMADRKVEPCALNQNAIMAETLV